MKFDIDRFAQLAGLPASKNTAPTPAVSAPSERAVMTESRRVPARAQESADIQKLRSIIRRETVAVLKQMNESKLAVREADLLKTQKSKSLNEAITMGFYGPGFGGKSFVLGGPLTSAARFSSLVEAEEMEEAAVASDEEGTLEMDEADDAED
jgi:hypothetical protein